jgi:hypothetical protein
MSFLAVFVHGERPIQDVHVNRASMIVLPTDPARRESVVVNGYLWVIRAGKQLIDQSFFVCSGPVRSKSFTRTTGGPRDMRITR